MFSSYVSYLDELGLRPFPLHISHLFSTEVGKDLKRELPGDMFVWLPTEGQRGAFLRVVKLQVTERHSGWVCVVFDPLEAQMHPELCDPVSGRMWMHCLYADKAIMPQNMYVSNEDIWAERDFRDGDRQLRAPAGAS